MKKEKDYHSLSDAALSRLIASGDAEAMFQTAVRVYGGYGNTDRRILAYNSDDIFRMMDMAAYYGDADMNFKVADFFRLEHQERRAKTYYQQAFVKRVEKAVRGDADAQFALCEHYTTGYGVPNDMESAGFWCMMAAKNGHKEATKMMQNFWRMGVGVPASREMAEKWEKLDKSGAAAPDAGNPRVRELRESAMIQKSLDDYERVGRELGKRPTYKVQNLTYRPVAAVRNLLSWLLKKGTTIFHWLYTIGSPIGLAVARVCGYRETGLVNLADRLFYWFLKLPLGYIHSLPKEMTCAEFCNWFQYFDFTGMTAAEVLRRTPSVIWDLIAWAILLAIWLVLVNIVVAFAGELLANLLSYGAIAVKKGKEQDYGVLPAWLEKLRGKTGAASAWIKENGNSQEGDPLTYLMAVCELADFYGLDLAAAREKYGLIRQAAPVDLSDYTPVMGTSTVAMRFLLLAKLPRALLAQDGMQGERLLFTDLCCSNLQGWENNATLILAYWEYRVGRNYTRAEELFNSVIKESKNEQEAAWATWFVAQMYRREHIIGKFGFESFDATDQRSRDHARKLEKAAAEQGCLSAVKTDAGLVERMFRLDSDALDYFYRNITHDLNITNYVKRLEEAEKQRMIECGYHFNEATWKGYDTGCLWAELAKLEEKDWSYLKDHPYKITPIADAGLERAKVLAQRVEYSRGCDMVQQDRMNRRNAQIQAQVRKYESALDERERDFNLFFNDSIHTNEERYFLNEISENDNFLLSEIRRNKVEAFTEKLENDSDNT